MHHHPCSAGSRALSMNFIPNGEYSRRGAMVNHGGSRTTNQTITRAGTLSLRLFTIWFTSGRMPRSCPLTISSWSRSNRAGMRAINAPVLINPSLKIHRTYFACTRALSSVAFIDLHTCVRRDCDPSCDTIVRLFRSKLIGIQNETIKKS